VRLEEALRYWENSLFLITAIGLADASPHITNLPEIASHLPLRTHDFRRRLLGSRNAEYAPESVFGTEDVYTATKDRIGHGSIAFPQLLWSWSRRSRRSYTLASDLQLQLAGTALSNVRVGDIPWPFDTFGVALPEPISTHANLGFEHRFDYLLVSRKERFEMTGDREMIVILLICRHLTGMQYMSPEERSRIAKEARRGSRWKDIGRFWGRYGLDKVSKDGCINPVFIAPAADTLLVDSLTQHMHNTSQDGSVPANKAMAFTTILNRVVFGLCLYLSTLTPEERRHHLRWSKGEPASVRRADSRKPETIGDEAEVCMVTSVQTISDRERELLRRIMQSGKEISLPGPHFCQGHWRRPPGKGDDPSAPRTVWVRPYETGIEQLGENELPGGALVKIK